MCRWHNPPGRGPENVRLIPSKIEGSRRWPFGLIPGWLVLLLFFGLVLPAAVFAQSPPPSPRLTNALDVFRLRPEEAATRIPIRLKAVVTYSNPINRIIFVQDDSGGVAVFCGDVVPPKLGELILVDAVSAAGAYGSAAQSPVFTVLGPGTLPEPLHPTFDELQSGRADSRWTEVEGTVRSAAPNGVDLILSLDVGGQRLKVACLDLRQIDPDFWVDARVRVRGVAGGMFNAKVQFIGTWLIVCSLDQIVILEPPHSDPYSLPLTQAGSLGHHISDKVRGEQIHLQGEVTLFHPGKVLYIRDGTGSIEVRTSQHGGAHMGDRVDVIGFYERGAASLLIEDGSFRRITNSLPPMPIASTIEELNSGRLDAELVSIEAEVLEWRREARSQILSLQAGEAIFSARLDSTNHFPDLAAHSRVRITGVCRVGADQDHNVTTFELLLRSPEDLVVLKWPSLWTLQRALWLLCGVGGVLGFALLWVVSLRNRVQQQTRTLKEKVADQERAEAAVRESQALYHSLVDQLPAGVFRKDREGRYVFVNSWFCKLKGVKPETYLGKTPIEVGVFDGFSSTSMAEYARGEADHEAILRTGDRIEVEESPQVDNGKRHLHVVKTPIFNAAGQIVGSQGLLFDITQRKRAETALAETSNLMETLLEHSPDLIYFKDAQSRFLRYSKAYLTKFGFDDPDALKDKTDVDLFAEEHALPAYNDEQQIIRTGKPILDQTEKEVWRNGRVTWVLTSKMPWRDANGTIIGTFGISKDVTAIKEAEAQLAEAHKRVVEISRQAGMAEVATSVLHNVGNVLNSVNISTSLVVDALKHSRLGDLGRVAAILSQHQDRLVEFLTNDPKGQKLAGYLTLLSTHLTREQATLLKEMEETRRNVEHIKEIVMMQQSFAKVSGITEKLKVVDLVEEALRMNSASLARHSVQIIRKYPDHVAEMTVDRHKVLQILINLIRNAKHACDDSERPDKCLTLQVNNGGDRVQIEIIDNGVGIPAENLTRIFQHGFTTRKNGHGFGLHSAALAARELHGSLSAQSAGTGTGARFTLDLPVKPPETAEEKPSAKQ